MDDHIAQFLNFLAVEKNASANTIAAYKNDLAQFEKFICAQPGPNQGAPTALKALGGEAIVAYVADLRARQYKDATVARKVAAVKSFFGFMASEGHI